MHRLSAHLMVAAVFLHLVRVFLTGAYKNGTGRGQRREWNWVIGVGMLLLDAVPVLHRATCCPGTSSPTGPSRSAPTSRPRSRSSGPAIRELLIGGRTIEQPTLIRFYVLHVLVLPGGARRALRVPHVARAQGRRPGPRRPRGAPRREASRSRRSRRKTYTLLGRRARHGAGDPRHDPRSART